MSAAMDTCGTAPAHTPAVHCPQCGNRLMGQDPDGELVIKGTRVLRLRGERFQSKCGRCKTWVRLPVGVVGV
jgi:hypothetical protein